MVGIIHVLCFVPWPALYSHVCVCCPVPRKTPACYLGLNSSTPIRWLCLINYLDLMKVLEIPRTFHLLFSCPQWQVCLKLKILTLEITAMPDSFDKPCEVLRGMVANLTTCFASPQNNGKAGSTIFSTILMVQAGSRLCPAFILAERVLGFQIQWNTRRLRLLQNCIKNYNTTPRTSQATVTTGHSWFVGLLATPKKKRKVN